MHEKVVFVVGGWDDNIKTMMTKNTIQQALIHKRNSIYSLIYTHHAENRNTNIAVMLL